MVYLSTLTYDVEEMLQEKRGQATYAQSKDYVLEQSGLKVSSLYISQVKRKCELDVGEATINRSLRIRLFRNAHRIRKKPS